MEITREQLLSWAGTPETARDLPRLVRRLIHETTSCVDSIDFPGGGGVASGGFDGVATVGSANEFVPAGVSVWELSVEASANAKANEDYAKRTSAPLGVGMADCTYVQLIARQWIDHADWAADKSQEGRWRDVRGYNVESLETWLERAPATTAWLARRLGLPSDGVSVASDWFEAWSNLTEPPTTRELLLAGRSRQAQQLRQVLSGPARVVTMGGQLRSEELRAFVAAAVTASEVTGSQGSKTLLVDDRGSFHRLLQHSTPAVLVVSDGSWLQATGPHHVVLVVPGGSTANIDVPPIDPAEFAGTLRATGLDERQSGELSELARRSLLAFRRRVAKNPSAHRPPWAGPAANRLHRRLLLVDRWSEPNESDHEAVAQLVGDDYADIEDELTAIAGSDEPMMALVAGIWHVVSPKDAWLLLGGQLSRTDLESFRAVVMEVLGERDPSLDLPKDERWLAAVRGVQRRYSVGLREGLARSLARLGAYDDTVETGRGMTGQRWADLIVGDLLGRANGDGSVDAWASIASWLPLLAEASPRTFLGAVRDGLAGDQPLLSGMFRDRDADGFGIGITSPHVELLWALERIAWAPEYFEAAVTVLAALAEDDPGGRVQNRPQESLASVFCPWRPQTSASEEQRMAALARLYGRFPDVGWKLLLSHVPDSSSFLLDQSGADYRDWGRERPPVTRAQHLRIVEAAAEMLISRISDHPERCVELIERADDLPAKPRRELAAKLVELAARRLLASDQQAQSWHALRGLVARHREYADTHWALPEAELQPLIDAMEALEPDDPAVRHAWLFADTLVTLGDLRRRDDHDAYEQALAARRRDAVAEILDRGGLDAVVAFSGLADMPRYVGVALGSTGDERHEIPILGLLDSDMEHVRSTASAYVWQRFRDLGWTWLDDLMTTARNLSTRAAARALLTARDSIEGALRASERGQDVSEAYWREFNYLGLGADLRNLDELARKLVDVGRPAAALDLLALYQRRRDNDDEYAVLVADAFEALLATPSDDEIHRLSSYELSVLFGVLADHRDTVGQDRVIRIEWNLAPALGYDPDLHTIYASMTSEPGLFVELVTLNYRSEDDDNTPTDDQRRAADNAFRVLSGWKTCPASDAKRDIDPDHLRSWVEDARARFAENGRGQIGDHKIGEALSHAPPDEDGSWPPQAVRDLLEDLSNDDIDRGFEIQTCNNRGTTVRDSAGGDQERELAATYQTYAMQTRVSAPRVAALLDRLADTYETEARQHDEQAEQRRRGLGW